MLQTRYAAEPDGARCAVIWRAPVPDAAVQRIAETLREEGWEARADADGLSVIAPLDDRHILEGGDAATLRITTGMEHPLAGVGYFAALTLPPLQRWGAGDGWCLILNSLEHKQEDFPPRLGAWGLRGGRTEIVYALFLPADEGSTEVTERIARWMLERAEWVRDELWEPDIGLYLREDAA